jgi:hypothetical protein
MSNTKKKWNKPYSENRGVGGKVTQATQAVYKCENNLPGLKRKMFET